MGWASSSCHVKSSHNSAIIVSVVVVVVVVEDNWPLLNGRQEEAYFWRCSFESQLVSWLVGSLELTNALKVTRLLSEFCPFLVGFSQNGAKKSI